ncbi:MAG: methylenetetrahydrofolate reductase [Actinobacteria bacterium]|nr:methylenetetrahydrofolate reductase [Actinomycetota bacterium]
MSSKLPEDLEVRPGKAEALKRLLGRPDFEIFPSASVWEHTEDLPPRAKVAVTCSPSRGIEATLALIEHLTNQGFAVLPHISSRLVTDRAHLQGIINRLEGLAVFDIFVIGGDVDQPVGPFPSALSLLTAMAEVGHHFSEIGVAAYPERHPFVDDDTLWRHLHRKQAVASYMTTQMCFDATAILRWIEEARRRGIGLPVRVGLPGVLNRNKLLKTSMRIGVGDSARFVRKHTGLLTKLIGPGRYSPDDLVASLAEFVDVRPYDLRGLHIYTFNEIADTERWRRAVLTSLEQ